MVSVFPCLSLPRPPRHHERGAKLKYSLNTFIRHNKLHQLLSSHTPLCSTNNYIIFPFGPRSETLNMQKPILHLEQLVWRSVCLLLIILPRKVSGIVPLTPNYQHIQNWDQNLTLELSSKIGQLWEGRCIRKLAALNSSLRCWWLILRIQYNIPMHPGVLWSASKLPTVPW